MSTVTLLILLNTELRKVREDPSLGMNLSADMKRVLQDMKDNKGRTELLLGGGGTRAREERAAALAALALEKEKALEAQAGGKVVERPKEKAPAMSIVDAASASVSGRSAQAAKAGSGDKTHAKIAVHAAGERTPVEANTRMVSWETFTSTLD